jgi:cytochrome c biogenesis protein CcmG/thiol:disulfide interchange protein DsbE
MTATSGDPVAGVTASTRHLPHGYYVAAALLPILLLAAWAALLIARPSPGGLAQIGGVAPSFTLADLDGNPLRLSDLRGRPVIVNFWASWCGPCIDEFPALTRAAQSHQAERLAVVGIVYRDQADAARAFLRRMGATWRSAMDPGDRVASQFGVIGAPETFFIDRNGVIVDRQIGQLRPADLQSGLDQILGKE